MKRLTFLKLAILPLVVYGCGGGGDGALNLPATNRSDYTLQPDARLIPNDGSVVLVSQTDSTLVLRGGVPTLAVGQVVVSLLGVGALRRITALSRAGDTWTLTTTPARLTDAFSLLQFEQNRPWGREVFGDLATSEKGVGFRWVETIPGAENEQSELNGATQSTLAIDFGQSGRDVDGESGFSLGGGITLTGTAFLRITPMLIIDISGATLNAFAVGIFPRAGGSVTITAAGSASYNGERVLVSRTFPPIEAGPVVFVPSLEIKVVAAASADAEVSVTGSVSAGGAATATWRPGQGWRTHARVSSSKSGGIQTAKGAMAAELKIIAEVKFMVYGLVGPYASLSPRINADATVNLAEDSCGVDARVRGALDGEVGIRVSGLLRDLASLVDVDLSDISYPFTIAEAVLAERSFPFPSVAIVVSDNGPDQDDVFTVSLDGVNLGSTPKGGSRSFKRCPITVGAHTLQITATDAGDAGDYATLAVGVSNGATLDDGNNNRSIRLDRGGSITLPFTVPEPVPGRSYPAPLPLPRDMTPERQR